MKKQRIVGRPLRWPLAREAAVRKTYIDLVAALAAAARTATARHGQALLNAGQVRSDAEPGDVLADIVQEVSAAAAGALLLLRLAIGQHGRAAAQFHKRDLEAIIRRAYGTGLLTPDEPWLQPLLRAWSDEAEDAARLIVDQYIARMRAEFTKAVVESRGPQNLRRAIIETTNIAENRAQFSARTLLGRFMALATERRFKALGVRSFIWTTQQDERVRVLHRLRHGVEYFYDRGGPRPGLEPGCRCVSAPVLPGLVAEQLGVTVR